jgi:hypothetical protein
VAEIPHASSWIEQNLLQNCKTVEITDLVSQELFTANQVQAFLLCYDIASLL